MENIGFVSIDDINTFAAEEGVTPQEHAALINDYAESKSDWNKTVYSDNPEKLILEQQKLQATTSEAMKTPREKEAYDRVYKASGEDIEQTNLNLGYMRMKAEGKPPIVESGFGTSYEYEPAGQKELNDLFSNSKDNPFQLTEKASLKTEYVSDNKGNPVAAVHVAHDGDNRIASFNLIEDGKETPPYSMKYSLPSLEEVDVELKRMYSEIEAMTPTAANDVGGLGDGVRARMKAGESKKWQDYRDKEKEYRFLQDLTSKNPEAAREYVATKNRDDVFSQSEYARENITKINPLKDLEKGVARFHYSTKNAIYDGKDEDTNNNLDVIGRDSSIGSQTYGLKKTGAMDDFLNRVPSGMESLGNMIPSLAASAVTRSPKIGLAAMGVGAYGSQLNQTDTLIDQVKSKLEYEQRTNPNSPEAFLLQKDLDKLVTNRRISAINHGANEIVTEGIGGFLGLVKIGKTAASKIAAGAISEILIEEQAAEALNRVTDLATQGDRIAPEMQNFLSLAYDTTISFGPLLGVGAAQTIHSGINENKEDAKDQARRDEYMKNSPKVRENYNLMTKTLADYASELPAYSEQIQKIKDSIVNPSIKDTKSTDAAQPKAETLAGVPVSDNTNATVQQKSTEIEIPVAELKPEVPTDSQSTEKPEASKPNPTLKVSRDMIDHGHNILEQSKDFSEWSKQMIQKFGEGNTVQALKAIYDYIVASAKKAYNAIGDAVTYVKSNMKGIDISMSQAKDRREFKDAIDPRTSTPEKLAAINKRFPGLYNEALQQILVEADGGLDHLDIDVTNLAKLYSFKERGFDGGSTMVDEGTFTANLENKDAEAPLVNPDGSPAIKDNPLTKDDQDVLKTLYDSKIISEDQLDSALNSLFKTRKFLSLFGRRNQMSIKNPNVDSLNNSTDSTITEREKRQSKIKEAYASESVMDPANPDHAANSPMPKSFVHGTSNSAEGTTDPMDVLAHLGITPTLQPYNETEDPNSPLRYNALTLSTKDKKKLYDFYDSQFGKNNWLIKDAAGAASQGLHLAEDLRRDIRKKTDMFEGVAQAKIPIHAEYRVNIYLDKDGKARAIPFAISKKNINSRGTSGSHFKPFTVSVDTHTALQKFAEKALQQVVDKKKDKATGSGAVYGVDVVISKDKKGNWEFKILEFNSPDPYFDKDNMGGTTGTFSRFNGFPLANLNAFLQGKVPADVSLTHIMAHMVKTGKMKVNGRALEAIPQDVKEKINKATSQLTKSVSRTNEAVKKDSQSTESQSQVPENPNANLNSGIDPTRLVSDLKTIYQGFKDLASFSAEAIKKFGEWIKPYLNDIFSQLKQFSGEITEDFLAKIGVIQYAVDPNKSLASKSIKKATPSRAYIVKSNGNRIDTRYLSDKSKALLDKVVKLEAKAKHNAKLMSQSDLDTYIYEFKKEESLNKFKELVKDNPEIMSGYSQTVKTFNYDIDAAREHLLDKLDEIAEPIESKAKRKMTPVREKSINQLTENLRAAYDYTESEDFKNLDPRLQEYLGAGIGKIFQLHENSDEVSTQNLNRASITLASLIDNGNPTGMYKYVHAWNLENHIKAAEAIKRQSKDGGEWGLSDLIGDPVSDLRRFQWSKEKGGTSLIGVAVELDKMSNGIASVGRYLHNLFSQFLGGMEDQSVELNEERATWTSFVESLFPAGKVSSTLHGSKTNMSYSERIRVGIASILTQYERGSTNPVAELNQYWNDLAKGIEYRSKVKGQADFAEADRIAFGQLTHNVDYSTMTEYDIINTIELNLTPNERKVLDELRNRSAAYLPSLRIVAGIVKNAPLVEYENYIKVKQKFKGSDQKLGGMEAFDSMKPVLEKREGLKRESGFPAGYYETDIMQVADSFFKEATYEKHTGIARTLIKGLLDDPAFRTTIEGPGMETAGPRISRLKQLLGNYHLIRSGNDRELGPLAGFSYSVAGLLKAALIVGFPPFMANLASASVNMASVLATNSRGMLGPVLLESSRPSVTRGLHDWLLNNYRSQQERLNSIDDAIPVHYQKSKNFIKIEAGLMAQRNVFAVYLQNSLGIASDVALKVAQKALGGAAHLSAGAIEAIASTKIFWTIYLSNLNDKGHSFTGPEDFLRNPVKDDEAFTDAMFQTDRVSGVSSMRESHGGFYHLDSALKNILNNTLFGFIRQQSQYVAQEGNEMSHILNQYTTPDEKAIHIARMSSIMGSLLFYTFVKTLTKTLLVSGLISIPYLVSMLSGEDDEEKKRLLREEIARRKKLEKYRAESSAMWDGVTAILGFPVLQTMLPRSVGQQTYDNLVTKREDIELQKMIDVQEAQLKIKKEEAEMVLKKTGGLDSYNRLLSNIEGLENAISEQKRLKGLRVQSLGSRQVEDLMGSLYWIKGGSSDINDYFLAPPKDARQLMIDDEIEKGDNIPFYMKFADQAFKTGIVSTMKSTNKRLAEQRVMAEEKAKRDTASKMEQIRKKIWK